MGLFSYPCQRCGRSILSEYSAPHDWLMHATMIAENKNVISGIYDGYGRLMTDNMCTVDLPIPFNQNDHKWRIWHTECYNLPDNRKDEPPEPKNAADQGYFILEKFYDYEKASNIEEFLHPAHSWFSDEEL